MNSPASTPTNTGGPAGTYGCACVSRDARNCMLLRYGYHDCGDARCECLCHSWDDDDDDAAAAPKTPEGH